MTAPQRVHVVHTFASDPATVFARLSEHENLGPVLGARISRARDGESSRNGVGSTRTVRIGPLPAFDETTTVSEPDTLIEYKISRGSPLRGHWGRQVLTPTATGGTTLDYTIGFDLAVPGAAALVGKVMTKALAARIGRLAP